MLVHPQFNPVAFEIGPLAVRWYGLMYLVAFVLFAVLGKLSDSLLTGLARPFIAWQDSHAGNRQ